MHSVTAPEREPSRLAARPKAPWAGRCQACISTGRVCTPSHVVARILFGFTLQWRFTGELK
jgi:hypothetical protein